MSMFNRLGLLLWKNFKLKIRNPWTLLFEIGTPCIFSLILVIVRSLVTFDRISTSTFYTPRPIFHDEFSKFILYAPNNSETNQIMRIFQNITETNPMKLKGFENEQQLLDHYMKFDGILCGVIFNSIKSNQFDFRLRFPYAPKSSQETYSMTKIIEFTWKTSRNFPLFQMPGPRSPNLEEGGPPGYYKNQFLSLQHYICRAFAYYKNPNASKEFYEKIQINIQRFPYPPYNDDKFLFSLQFMFPIVMMISFIYPYVNLTKNIVLEKELRLKEAMKMMNMKDWMHWLSWFLDSLIWNSISLIIITFLFCFQFHSDFGIIYNSNPVLIFIFFFFYMISSITLCFLLSTFFSNANIAGIAAGAIYFISFLPYFQINYNYHELSLTLKIAIGLIFNTNMAIGCMMISIWESNHIGLQWSNLMESASLDDTLNFFNILLMFIIDSIIYLLAALYISNVFPGRYGIPRKWYYFLQPSYWFPRKHNIDDELSPKNLYGDGIQMVNLSKSYNHGKIKALKDLNLTIKKNEITVLLGHNGAGKTTLMSILCGLLPSTSGSIYINGYHFVNDIDEIRKNLGVCPQFDVLFNHLTVEEHLWFYCKLKNVNNEKIKEEIDRMIKLLDFVDKRHNQAYTLSGGMKRKLSVGIALVGDSKIVLLDEATSGMDVSARRFIWDLLIREKKNRVILLSTHFMEEADVLGDEIAVIENGQLKCSGSPMELKKKFGIGYLLTLAINEKLADVKTLENLIKSYIHHSKILTSIGREVTFSLPENQLHKFQQLFTVIEQNSEKLGIINYGISVTTLEEVFLRVGDFSKQGTEQINSFYKSNCNGSQQINQESILKKIQHNSLKLNRGMNYHLQVFYSLFVKKFLFTYRNIFTIFSQFILPGLLLALSIMINRDQMDKSVYSPPLNMNFDNFHKIQATVFRDQNDKLVNYSKLYKDSIINENPGTMTIVDEIVTYNNTDDYAIEYLINYGSKDEDRYNLYYIMSIILWMDDDIMKITALFNNQAYHSSPISVSYMDRMILKQILKNDKFRLSIWNDPLPKKHSDLYRSIGFDSTVQIQFSNNLQFAMSFLLASFIIFLVKEKSSNFKHIQRITGLHMFKYWTSTFIIDISIYIISSIMICLIIYLLDVHSFISYEQQGYLFLLFVAHGIASLPIIYLFSLYFRDAPTAYVRLSLYLLIFGTTTFLVVVILQIPALKLKYLSDIFDLIFAFIIPIYNLSIAVFSLSENYLIMNVCLSNITLFNQTHNIQELCNTNIDAIQELKFCCKGKCGDYCADFDENHWKWEKPGIGKNLTAFLVQTIVFWLLLIYLEKNKQLINLSSCCYMKTNDEETTSNDRSDDHDSDVENEKHRLKHRNLFTLFRSDSMIVQNVRKMYGNFPAVRDISFGVKRGECFGILGENGAGKTTLFKMITGDETITSGNIIINGHNNKKQMDLVYKDIGYCPQFDGLVDHLTGRETLRIISRIRGIQERFIDSQIDALSELLYFKKHIDDKIKSYSGGTKRKLSFAISILGNPLIVFLDEPTTGVDPVSRRCLWNAIHLVRAAGSSLILTSHSMEECEALCNRLIIMVHGKLVCLGSPMHLKRKYGAGYVVQIKLKNSQMKSYQDICNTLNHFMQNNFIECYLDSTHNNSFTYRIQANQIKLSFLFGQIEKFKHILDIDDYSIYQTSLERIFLSFVRK